MNFTLTISASPELQAVLEKLAGNFSASSENGQSVEEPKKERKARTTKETPLAPPVVEDDGLGDEPAVVHTIESIRALGRQEATRVGPDKVRGLVKELGFDKLPDMTADKFGEFAEKVKLLK